MYFQNQCGHGVMEYKRGAAFGTRRPGPRQRRKWKLRGERYLAKSTQPGSSTICGTLRLVHCSTLPSGGEHVVPRAAPSHPWPTQNTGKAPALRGEGRTNHCLTQKGNVARAASQSSTPCITSKHKAAPPRSKTACYLFY